MTNFIDYHKPDTRKGELMKKEMPLIKIHAEDGRFRITNESVASQVVNQIKSARNATGLQSTDYVRHRKTDRLPERQDGAGALYWIVVAATCWIVIIALCASAGYFD
jgi:hypothetical protein